jgi:HEAT repeat protein
MPRHFIVGALLFAAVVAITALVLRSPPVGPTNDVKKVTQSEAEKNTQLAKGATEGRKSDPPTAPTLPVPAKYVPPVVHNPALAAFVNRESQDERVTADIHVRLPKVEHPDDVKAVVSVLLDTQDDDTVRHEAANLLRRSNYPGLTADLLTVLQNPDEKERFRAFVTQHLWSQAEGAQVEARAQIVGELHDCLTDRHTAVRREALLALVRLNDPAGTETALKWFAEAKPETSGVMDLCIRVIRERDLREYLPAVRALIKSPNEDAARQAMVTVGQWGDQESRPLLEDAAKSTRPLLKRAADAALKKLDQARTNPTQPDNNKGSPETSKVPVADEPKPKF